MQPLQRGLGANAEANGPTLAQADVRDLQWGDDTDPKERPAVAAMLRCLWRDDTVGWEASEVRCGVEDLVVVRPMEDSSSLGLCRCH